MSQDRILVIEDSRLFREVLRKTLTNAGYDVTVAENGRIGVDLACQSTPALVITDMDMPVLSGREVCQHLKANAETRMVPIIMFTARDASDKIEQLDAGADDYLPKSPEFGELLAKVRVFLRIKHLQDQLREKNDKLKYENEMNEKELQMARELQLGLLPRENGQRGRLDVAFRYLPMRFVGGDLFDVIGNGDGSTTLFISDVSGHGVVAAFVTAMIKTSVLAYSSKSSSIVDLVGQVNRAISNLIGDEMFVTAFFGTLNAEGTAMEYINAGHQAPLLLRRGTKTVEELKTPQLPLGVMGDMDFSAERIAMGCGDRLILYTDGITEAPNAAQEQFGAARFLESVVSRSEESLEKLVDGAIKDLVAFSGREVFDDDVNLVACEVTGKGMANSSSGK